MNKQENSLQESEELVIDESIQQPLEPKQEEEKPTLKQKIKNIPANIKTVVKTIGSDFRSLRWYEVVFFVMVAILLVIVSIYNFNFKDWVWNTPAVKGQTWKETLAIMSGFAAWTGITYVIMLAKGKISAYFFGMINITIYGLFAFSVGYTGDALLNLFFFLPTQFIGLYFWRRHMNKKTVINNKLNIKTAIISFVIFAVLWAAFYFFIPVADKWLRQLVTHGKDTNPYVFTDDATMRSVLATWHVQNIHVFKGQAQLCHLLDSFTNAISIVAMVLLLKRYKEQWIMWIFLNIAQIAMFAGLNGQGASIPMILMWGVFLINAFYGFAQWLKREKANKAIIEADMQHTLSNPIINKQK